MAEDVRGRRGESLKFSHQISFALGSSAHAEGIKETSFACLRLLGEAQSKAALSLGEKQAKVYLGGNVLFFKL